MVPSAQTAATASTPITAGTRAATRSMYCVDAVIVAGEQSGSLRYYTGRSILRWDAASPEALSAAIEAVNEAGRPVVVALDAWEHEPFRARHGGLPAMSLEWPPAFEAGSSHRTRVWRLSDRDRFLSGESIPTVRQP